MIWKRLWEWVLIFGIGVQIILVFEDASISWPSSWALTARWPWWAHFIIAVCGVLWLQELRNERKASRQHDVH